MILPDSNIFIDYWDRKDSGIGKVFEQEEIAVCGVVIAEVLHGCRSERSLKGKSENFRELPLLEVRGDEWLAFGEMLQTLRKNGLTVPFQDALIAFIGMLYDIPVWTRDAHFSLISKCFPSLRLYDPSKILGKTYTR